MSEVAARSRAAFDRVNLEEVPLERVRAHDGEGDIAFCRLAEAGALGGACRFLDLAILPPGASVGRHRHDDDEEEFYLILAGEGRMWRDGVVQAVRAGDLVRTPPGGAHGLENDGSVPLRMFVFAVAAGGAPR